MFCTLCGYRRARCRWCRASLGSCSMVAEKRASACWYRLQGHRSTHRALCGPSGSCTNLLLTSPPCPDNPARAAPLQHVAAHRGSLGSAPAPAGNPPARGPAPPGEGSSLQRSRAGVSATQGGWGLAAALGLCLELSVPVGSTRLVFSPPRVSASLGKSSATTRRCSPVWERAADPSPAPEQILWGGSSTASGKSSLLVLSSLLKQ